jgi:hypothetical protein
VRAALAFVLCITATLALTACGSSGGSSSGGPQSGLADYGKILWNFEALANDHYGTTAVCSVSSTLQAPYLNYTTAACKLTSQGVQVVPYHPAFDDPHGSHFTLTDRPPNLAVNLEPIKLAGRWVACAPRGTWLEISPDLGWICANRQGAATSP